MTPTQQTNHNRRGGVGIGLLVLLNVLMLAIIVGGGYMLYDTFDARLAAQQEEFDRQLAALKSESDGPAFDVKAMVQTLLDEMLPAEFVGMLTQLDEVRSMLAPLAGMAEKLQLLDGLQNQLGALKVGQELFKLQLGDLSDLQGELFDLKELIKALPFDTGAAPAGNLNDTDQLRELLEKLSVALPATAEAQSAPTSPAPVELDLPDTADTPEPASDDSSIDPEQVEMLIRILKQASESLPPDGAAD